MYAEQRQCPTNGPPTEEIEAALCAVVDRFTQAWLTDQSGAHELQRLWCRKDSIATIELVTFGSALRSAGAIDHVWTHRQVGVMRGPDANNRRGACFEILGLGYFAPTYHVTPAPNNQPGYDLNVRVADDYQLRVSLKCYAESSHERNFQQRAAKAKEKFLHACSERIHAVQVVVEAVVHPNEDAWQRLFAKLTELAARFNGFPLTVQLETWTISLCPLAPPPGETLAHGHLSHTFICVAPYHKNEQQNFLSKLEVAISNAERNIRGSDDGFPWIMIRLPPTACSNSLQAWTQEYLNGLADPKVLCVSFLQPYIVVDEKKGTTYIAHYCAAAASGALVRQAKGALRLVTPFGVPTSQPPLWQLNGSDTPVPVNDRYIYQSGKHFALAGGNGSDLQGNVSIRAPGIEQVAVFRIGSEQIVIAGRWGAAALLLIGG